MATDGSSHRRTIAAQIHTETDGSTLTNGSAFFSLLDGVESEEIGTVYGLGIHSNKHDFTEHVKIVAYEGLESSDSLKSLEQKTETQDTIEFMSESNFSRLTNDRDYRAVVTLFDELLHTPQLYHKLGCTRKRLEWLERDVVAVDATNLSLGTTLVVPSEMRDTDTDEPREIRPEDGGLKLHLAARVDGDTKQPLSAVVTPHDQHETTQFGQLQSDVEVADDLDSPIRVIDRGYVDYNRYCDLQAEGTDFVTTLRSNARTEVVEPLHDFEVQDETGSRHITDDRIELGETGEEFRRVTVEDIDGEVTEYLTTLSAAEYDPVDVISIYTLRTLIEILFRELKQYTNVQEFHSKSFNGALFELFCTLIAYLLVEWYRHRHPLRGGVAHAIRTIRNKWDQPLPEYG